MIFSYLTFTKLMSYICRRHAVTPSLVRGRRDQRVVVNAFERENQHWIGCMAGSNPPASLAANVIHSQFHYMLQQLYAPNAHFVAGKPPEPLRNIPLFFPTLVLPGGQPWSNQARLPVR